jgi:hypothetical protein
VTESDEYKKGEEKLKVKQIVKKIQQDTPEELKQALIREFDADSSVHVLNLRHQFRQYKHIEESMRADEAVLHVEGFCPPFACLQCKGWAIAMTRFVCLSVCLSAQNAEL